MKKNAAGRRTSWEQERQAGRDVQIERLGIDAETLLAQSRLDVATPVHEAGVHTVPIAAGTNLDAPAGVLSARRTPLLIGAAAAILAVVLAGWYLASRPAPSSTTPELTVTQPDDTRANPGIEPPPPPAEPPAVGTTGATVERVRELLGRDDTQALGVLTQGLRQFPSDEQLTTLLLDLLRTARTEAAEARDGLLREKAPSSARSARAWETLQKLEQQGRSGASVDLVRD